MSPRVHTPSLILSYLAGRRTGGPFLLSPLIYPVPALGNTFFCGGRIEGGVEGVRGDPFEGCAVLSLFSFFFGRGVRPWKCGVT